MDAPRNVPRIVRVRTMFFMILSHRLLQRLSAASTLGSGWLSSILTSTCFCILLALKQQREGDEMILVTDRLPVPRIVHVSFFPTEKK